MDEKLMSGTLQSTRDDRLSAIEQLQQIVKSHEEAERQSLAVPVPVAPAQMMPNENAGALQTEYAGFWIRYVAYMVDGAILSVPMLMMRILISNKISYFILSMIIGWTYFIAGTALYRATLGKRIMRIIVTRSDGDKVSWGRALLRETIGKIASGVILLIGYIMAGFTEKKQALHDVIAGTIVVHKDPIEKVKKFTIILAILISISIYVATSAAEFFINLNKAKSENPEMQKVIDDIKSSLGLESQSVQGSGNLTENSNQLDALAKGNDNESDIASKAIILAIKNDLGNYYASRGSYRGYVLRGPQNDNLKMPKVDISPDGKYFIVHSKTGRNNSKSWCIENGMNDVVEADSLTISKTYHCK